MHLGRKFRSLCIETNSIYKTRYPFTGSSSRPFSHIICRGSVAESGQFAFLHSVPNGLEQQRLAVCQIFGHFVWVQKELGFPDG
jgi:hypothetical protein